MSAPNRIRSVTKRPAYVAPDFAGGCKVFPAPRADGREPILIAFQADWVLDNSRRKLGEKSRQVGWSWSEAYKIVRDKSQAEAQLDQWISSRDDIQARLFLEDCKMFAPLLQVGATDLGMQAIDEKGHTAYVLAFANGLRSHSIPTPASSTASPNLEPPGAAD